VWLALCPGLVISGETVLAPIYVTGSAPDLVRTFGKEKNLFIFLGIEEIFSVHPSHCIV
jgi:hypothetical protein